MRQKAAGAAGGAERAALPQGNRQKFKASSNSRPARADVGHADLGVPEDVAAIGGVRPPNKGRAGALVCIFGDFETPWRRLSWRTPPIDSFSYAL